MKKLLILITSVILLTPTITSAHAEPVPTLAILDTALDTSLPIFNNKIVYEACILEYASCANGQKTMFGPGAASMPLEWMKTNGFEHGTMMTSVAVKSNSNMNIVFVRIIPHNLITGVRKPVSNYMVGQALNWVYANRSTFNIQAVAMSQGSHNLLTTTDYCPKDATTQNAINNLMSADIPTFLAVGNNRDYKRIDWPSCIPNSIAIGATDQINEISSYANYDKLLDLYAPGYANMYVPGGTQTYGVGTSISTQVAASQYIAIKSVKTNYTFNQIYDLILKTSIVAKSGRVPYGKLINLQGALNG